MKRKLDYFGPLASELPPMQGGNFRGEIGVEIEVEGENLPGHVKSYWSVHHEGSLRGEAQEYVFTKPATRRVFGRYLDYLGKVLKNAGAVCNMSPRTSVHVHINMSDKSLVQCLNYILCYLIVEDLLDTHAGPTRVGNVFCLRAQDAEFFVDFLVKCIKTKSFDPNPERLRYTNVNICAIPKFNSIEFRALRGTVDMNIIKDWVHILLSLKDVAVSYNDPTEIMADFSRFGPEDFIRKLLPDHYQKLIALLPNWQKHLWDAAHLVQEIAFASDWKPEKKKGGRLFQVEPVVDEPDWALDDEQG